MRAMAALQASGGRVDPVPAFVAAGLPYARAGAELVWIGPAPRTRHPRMIVLPDVPPSAPLAIDLRHARCWQPPAGGMPQVAPVAERLVRLIAALVAAQTEGGVRVDPAVSAPRGFAAALVGQPLGFPLERAFARLHAFAAALAQPQPDSLLAAATGLLGVGSGLTPSGDDVVGGALFALAHRPGPVPHWLPGTIEAIHAAARERTHAISASLLVDLAAGQSYAVLHDFLSALVLDRDASGVPAALGALTALGHTSGWDLFAGFALAVLQPVCPFEV
jgi:hypothetical protein